MDRNMEVAHLSQAERHVSQGTANVERQRALVKQLELDGHDTEVATKLLRQFEEVLKLHIKDRDRIRAELAESERGLTIDFELPRRSN
jgi:hypothetical protein